MAFSNVRWRLIPEMSTRWSARRTLIYQWAPLSSPMTGRRVFAAAEAALTKALSLAPDYAWAHLALGVVHILTNRAAEGIAECEQALALDRNLADAHVFIGWAKFLLGRGAETEAHINEALRLSPRDIGAFRWKHGVGVVKSQLGADAEAVVWFRRSIEANPKSTDGAFPSSRFSRAARRAEGSTGRRASGTCAQPKLHCPPLPRRRSERQSDLPCRARAPL